MQNHTDLIGYPVLLEKAMKGVIQNILKKIEKHGLPKNHYFEIVFDTKHKNVLIPKHLKKQYPEEMKIILQHQFKNLKVEKDYFKVDLSFNKKFTTVQVPLDAITIFEDPYMEFELCFTNTVQISGNLTEEEIYNAIKQEEEQEQKNKIISFDSIKNKKDK